MTHSHISMSRSTRINESYLYTYAPYLHIYTQEEIGKRDPSDGICFMYTRTLSQYIHTHAVHLHTYAFYLYIHTVCIHAHTLCTNIYKWRNRRKILVTSSIFYVYMHTFLIYTYTRYSFTCFRILHLHTHCMYTRTHSAYIHVYSRK